MKLSEMNAGKSLKIAMLQHEVSRAQLAKDLNVTETTITNMRYNKTISGRNLVMLSQYFNMTASDFIRLGESEG